ncbi:MAG: extracellular solute-binding protein [Proteobacteria bacterium]|nr:extracellular solute-binding protein [Pseudomonadota bacterium]
MTHKSNLSLRVRLFRGSKRFLAVGLLAVSMPSNLFSQTLPANVKWLSNDSDPEYADLNAKRGGTLNKEIDSFPATLRSLGPDSNGAFANYLNPLSLSLVGVHPNTLNIIPQLATHWAYDADGRTMYFKLNPKAEWSDGKPITADDFVFTMEFHKSKVAMDPFYQDFWKNELELVFKIDPQTVGVRAVTKKPQSDLYMKCNVSPTPKHAFGGKLPDEYVQAFNWKILPTSAAYEISEVKKGKYVTFKRRKSWFLDDARYYRGRFNVEKIQFDIVRDKNVAWEMFKKAQLSNFFVTPPTYWHDKGNEDIFKNGYVHKLWFYTDSPESAVGFWLNTEHPLLADLNIRLGLAHSFNIPEVINKLIRGEYEHLAQAFVGYGKYTDTSIKPRKFDLKLADEYFTKAGWTQRGGDGIRVKDGKRLSFNISYGGEIMNGRLALLKEEAKKAGVELNLQLMDGVAAFKLMREKKHEIAYSAWTTNLRPNFHQGYHSENAGKPQTNNVSNTKDPELDKLIDKERTTFDEPERIKLSKEIQRRIHDGAYLIPSFGTPFYRDAYWRWFKLPKVPGVKLGDSSLEALDPSQGGLFWIDEDVRKETLEAIKSGKKFPEVVIIDKTFKANK